LLSLIARPDLVDHEHVAPLRTMIASGEVSRIRGFREGGGA
jgi:hypothetical protein